MTYATKFNNPRPITKSKRIQPICQSLPSSGSKHPKRQARKSRREFERALEKAGRKRKKLPVQFQERIVSILEAKERLNSPSIIPFQGILSDGDIKRTTLKYLNPESRNRLFDMTTTLWIFLTQVLDPDHTCRGAVARFLAFLANEGRPTCSLNTGSYCKARARLPEGMISDLARHTAAELELAAPRHWFWKGRSIKLVDGSTLSMPDTPSNQKSFPQPKSQKKGIGFPITRVVALISMATGAVLDFSMGAYAGKGTGEHALLRPLMHNLAPGDILMGDGYYGCFFLLSSLKQAGVDGVFPIHGARKFDFRSGERLGARDHVVYWHKPSRPKWMDRKTYDSYPDKIKVREVQIDERGQNSGRVLVTTLLDNNKYSRADLSMLYASRWLAEVDLNAIKSTMQMGILRGKTPEMVRKEIWTHLLGYNLIRKIISQSAAVNDKLPRQISFAGALQTVNSFRQSFQFSEQTEKEYRCILDAIASQRVGNRPGRSEPRKVKRRPKPFGRLIKPRSQYKNIKAADAFA